jgi:hypothetical protein
MKCTRLASGQNVEVSETPAGAVCCRSGLVSANPIIHCGERMRTRRGESGEKHRRRGPARWEPHRSWLEPLPRARCRSACLPLPEGMAVAARLVKRSCQCPRPRMRLLQSSCAALTTPLCSASRSTTSRLPLVTRRKHCLPVSAHSYPPFKSPRISLPVQRQSPPRPSLPAV